MIWQFVVWGIMSHKRCFYESLNNVVVVKWYIFRYLLLTIRFSGNDDACAALCRGSSAAFPLSGASLQYNMTGYILVLIASQQACGQ